METLPISLEYKRKAAIKGAGYTLERAAEKLKISRTTLYTHLGKANLPEEFVQNVKAAIGIDLSIIANEGERVKVFDASKDGVSKEMSERIDQQQDNRIIPIALELAVKVLGELYRSPEYVIPIIKRKVSDASRTDRVSFAFEEASALVGVYNPKLLGQ